jgi:enamine deaminase RidA (YjgF/YER057c/UK114 family)
MDMKIINPPGMARPSGYSHGVIANGGKTLYLAGQPGIDASGKVAAPGDLVAQFTQALANMQTVVEAAGGTMVNVVKLTFFVVDKDAYKELLKPLGTEFRSFFKGHYPATTLVEVRDLFDENALIEIEGIAAL